MKIQPGNIYSGDRQRAVFTNPTVLAKRKGNLRNDYPVKIDGRTFPDAEAAYQFLARDCKSDLDSCMQICKRVVEAKLRQYPNVLAAIRESGGSDWIKRCSHRVGARTRSFSRWEGDGLGSAYIRCLLAAYEAVERS